MAVDVPVDIALIVIACIIPCLLIFFNLVVMAHYIDPQAAAGHYVGKIMIVGSEHEAAERPRGAAPFKTPRSSPPRRFRRTAQNDSWTRCHRRLCLLG